ncbi:aspartate/glutamate racemase family protein [Planomicrobium sp. CPCC 101079]|uniref:aspartate/glutamate racemase family protein n=1 Tax=Planomicrobium sp. CPCC 101079 TaxID=2599618 RepID=UPI0011B60B5B|nr:aspartate/glutamate racemase family protein [Planomicrobium sp. CPCC 101079]TWT16085.1 aspartate/glutamate racemase family protein [Planomicrobium sp. CPCC 101079]
MKTIGLIGGMSWESSAEYYRVVNEEVQRKLGGLHSAKCILFSVDFEEIERMQRQDKWMEAGRLLAEAAQTLEKAGAELVVLCTNTMHIVIEALETAVEVPIVHIADATVQKIHEANLTTIGLLGTNYTMEMDFYKSRLIDNGLIVLVPDETDRNRLNQIIFDELCVGEIRQPSKKFYQKVIDKLIKDGAEGIILGCTEIGLLIKPEDSPVPVFDTAEIHAKTAVEIALGEKSAGILKKEQAKE